MAEKRGRPRIILDAEQITRFIGKGFTVQYVADYFSVHVDTLYTNYSDALRKGRVFRDGCLQARQYQKAMVKGDTTMLIWLGKQFLGQKDKVETSDNQNGNFALDGFSSEEIRPADRCHQPN